MRSYPHDCTNVCAANNVITNADIRSLIALQAGKMSMKAIISDVRRHFFQRVASLRVIKFLAFTT
jgi:hypothetical protein